MKFNEVLVVWRVFSKVKNNSYKVGVVFVREMEKSGLRDLTVLTALCLR